MNKMKLILAANTPIDRIELALDKYMKKINKFYKIDILFNIDKKRLTSKFLIFIGVNVWYASIKYVCSESICIVIDDPMELSRIKGKNIMYLDFKPVKEGYGYKFEDLSELDIAKNIYIQSTKDSTITVIEPKEYLSKILNSVPVSTTFVSMISSIIYSIKGDQSRNNIRKTFIDWCADEYATAEDLKNHFMRIIGLKRVSSRLKALQTLFNSEPGKKAKKAAGIVISTLYNNQKQEKKKIIPYDKLAEKYNISVYDLKYIANMIRKNFM